MKKLVFTALAVVAFSGVAMANKVAENEMKLFYLLDKDCVLETADKMECLDPGNELSPQEAAAIYNILYSKCTGGGTVKSITQE
jgi:hypothetical protein